MKDTLVIEELTKAFAGKRILLIGPGKSIIDANEKINKLVSATDVITIGLNTMRLDNDYLLTTRKEIYDKAVKDGLNTIVCSNVSKGGRGNVKILNYANWIEVTDRTHDSWVQSRLRFF